MKRGSAAELRPCLGKGPSQGEESVWADSGRAGEVAAGVGRVSILNCLSIRLNGSPLILFLTCRRLKCCTEEPAVP